jgi:hypothetical protein
MRNVDIVGRIGMTVLREIGQDSRVFIAKQPEDAREEQLLKIDGEQLSSFQPN